MIQLSDDLILTKIQTQNAYCDRKSEEKSTGVIKEKYKLAGNIMLDIYTFFVLTKHQDTCYRYLTLVINKNDWEDRHPRCLESDCSYLDINKVESFNKEEILEKCRDKTNGLPFVAKLCDQKFNELKNLKHKVKSSYKLIPESVKNLIFQALEEAKVSDNIIDKLNLS